MTIIKRCELCKGYLDCEIHDKVCENLKFLQNFLYIKESEEIAKYCKSYGTYTKNRGDYPKWYAGWDKNEIITKFEDKKSYLKALKKR